MSAAVICAAPPQEVGSACVCTPPMVGMQRLCAGGRVRVRVQQLCGVVMNDGFLQVHGCHSVAVAVLCCRQCCAHASLAWSRAAFRLTLLLCLLGALSCTIDCRGLML